MLQQKQQPLTEQVVLARSLSTSQTPLPAMRLHLRLIVHAALELEPWAVHLRESLMQRQLAAQKKPRLKKASEPRVKSPFSATREPLGEDS